MYRLNHKSKKWYMRIFFLILVTSVINAWLLYWKECSFFQVPGKHQLDLLNFTSEVSFSLAHNNKAILPSKRGRRRPRINENISYDSPNSRVLSLDLSIDESCSRTRKLANIQRVPDDVRLDGYCHWPLHDPKRPYCAPCKAKTRISCSKCEKGLCLNENWNCFKDFHTQK